MSSQEMLDKLLFFLATRFGHLAVMLLGATWRVKIIGYEKVLAAWEKQTPFMYTVWHGRMLVPVWHNRKRKICAMISQHRDGELVSRLVINLGYDTVRGSSTRGGSGAALELIKKIKRGQPAAMICDGPRGPIYKMKPGAPFLALETNAVVAPVCAYAKKSWVFRSWDQFMVPKPFAKVYVLYGDLIPPQNTDLKSFTRELEEKMNELKDQVEKLAE